MAAVSWRGATSAISTLTSNVLILVLPEFGGEQRLEAYNGVVRDALAEAYVNAASSLEDQVRLSGYRRSLERLLRLQQQLGGDAPAARPGRAWKKALDHGPLGRRFSIGASEEADAREPLDPASGALRRTTQLLDRLEPQRLSLRCLTAVELRHQPQLVAVLEHRLRHREDICLEVLLWFLALVLLGDLDQERARDCGEALGAPSYPDWCGAWWSGCSPSALQPRWRICRRFTALRRVRRAPRRVSVSAAVANNQPRKWESRQSGGVFSGYIRNAWCRHLRQWS